MTAINHTSEGLIKQLLNYGCIIGCSHIIWLSVCLHRRVQFSVLISSKSFCLMTFYQCYYDFINISISAVNDHISLWSPEQPIISPAHLATVNEQFNLEQREDLFSTGLGTVSLLQSMAQLYLQLSRDDLSAAKMTSPFYVHFPHFPPFYFCSWSHFSNVLSYRGITHCSWHFPPSSMSKLKFYCYRNISQRKSRNNVMLVPPKISQVSET